MRYVKKANGSVKILLQGKEEIWSFRRLFRSNWGQKNCCGEGVDSLIELLDDAENESTIHKVRYALQIAALFTYVVSAAVFAVKIIGSKLLLASGPIAFFAAIFFISSVIGTIYALIDNIDFFYPFYWIYDKAKRIRIIKRVYRWNQTT